MPGRVGEPASHAGEEWIYVLSGAIEVDLNGSVCSLGADDAVHFRADVPHALRNPHEEGAKVLIVNSLESPSLHLGLLSAPRRLAADVTRRRRSSSLGPVRSRGDGGEGRGADRRVRCARRRARAVPGGVRRLLPEGHRLRRRGGAADRPRA